MNFDKYVGKEIKLREIVHEYKGKKHSHFEVDENDPVASEIIQQYPSSGHKYIRWWTPGMAGTMDYNPSRLNVYIEKDNNGIFKIANFGMG